MSLISQLRHRLPHVLLRHPILYNATAQYPAALWTRNFAQQSARKEEEEDGGVEIDQRRLPADYDPSTFDPTEHHSPPTERVWRLVDEVSGLSLLEVAELSGILMKRLGSVAGVMSMKKGPAAAAAEEEKKPEKTVFELKLESYDAAQKIKIIKEVRGFTDLGLKEAKDLVEKSPAIFKKGVSKEEGEQIIEKMKAVGAKVVME